MKFENFGGYYYTISYSDIYEENSDEIILRTDPYLSISNKTSVPKRYIMRYNNYVLPSKLKLLYETGQEIFIPEYQKYYG